MPAPRILIVDDEKTMRESLSLTFQEKGYEVHDLASGEEAIEFLKHRAYDLALVDLRMKEVDGLEVLKKIKQRSPLTEVVMITAYGSIENAVDAIKNGAYDYITKPFRASEVLLVAERALEKKVLTDRVRFLEEQLREKYRFDEIVGRSPQMLEVMKLISQISCLDSTVLIKGESGTGKELIARSIHFNSRRIEKQFVIVNCAAIPETLQESELFGHVRGAFTNAKSDRMGLLEEADGGTLFLDEVGELSLSAQAKMLRFIQSGELRPIGGNKIIHADVRIISATNRDLKEDVKKGKFREDLYYRLNVIEIAVPPLRQREGDLELLAKHFINKYSKKMGKRIVGISRRALAALLHYDWPGNVRELENIIERAVAISSKDTIYLEDLPEALKRYNLPAERRYTGMRLMDIEKDHIEAVLKESGGNRTKTARCLGISQSTLWRKIREYHLDV